MNRPGGWFEKRRRIRRDIADLVASRTGIARDDFLEIFYDAHSLPSIGDFDGQYVPDGATLEEIVGELARLTGLAAKSVKGYLSRGETFPQFAERLLRAGAYAREGA